MGPGGASWAERIQVGKKIRGHGAEHDLRCGGVGARGVQEMALNPTELELKVAVRCLIWVLGNKLKSSVRIAHALTTSHLSNSKVSAFKINKP